MFNNKSYTLKGLLISILISLLTVLYIVTEGSDNILLNTLYFTNSLLCLLFLFKTERIPFSLNKFVNIFIFIFFILANGLQCAHDSNVLTFNLQFVTEDFIRFQTTLFFIIVIYNLCYAKIPPYRSDSTSDYSFQKTSDVKLVFIALLATYIILDHYDFNVFQLFTRGMTNSMLREYGIQIEDDESSQADNLIFSKFIRPIPWAAFIVAYLSKQSKYVTSFLFVLMTITVFPTGLGRNATAIYWLPIVILLFQRFIKGNYFIYLMFAGIFFLFPFFDNFRYFNGSINFDFSPNYLDSINFDAGQIFMATMKTETITFGQQLLGALLFFVPRTLWPGKPVGSGHFLVTEHNGYFPNVSMPFFSEGYINFGYIGMLLFVLILAYITKKLDSKFWRGQISNLAVGYYLIVLGALIFIMRGDLMSSFAYTIGISISYTVTLFFSKEYKLD